ncbi:hypothetical protein PIB30_046044 [Stylosanthes scabra]|uniref:Wound-responsive family protein n=1 Tax=Stylosanthes scabra TaxID=79078 RepID=A0ABU6QGX7_9FABA|nr:hypothetical protein [Stylosanthes scabra]
MSGKATRAWMVASSIGVVEALKDQLGVCRWNYAFRSLQQHAKNNIRSYTQAPKFSSSSSSSAAVSNKVKRTKEDSIKKSRFIKALVPPTAQGRPHRLPRTAELHRPAAASRGM